MVQDSLFQEKCRCLNLAISGMNGFGMIRHGLILWENGPTPLGIILKYLPDLNKTKYYKKVRDNPFRADYSSFSTN